MARRGDRISRWTTDGCTTRPTPPTFRDGSFSPRIRHSTSVPSFICRTSLALGLLQCNHVKFDTLCSSEKGMHVSVCGHCSRVAGTQSPWRVVLGPESKTS
ncbi:hypothetical protein RB195_012848 [Necator americanus]|uniref:Uncharacterized protein n=1 Tax=Necator americanus TaxID=51031 RepID=A0ABR1DSV0_NECAM